MQIFLFHEGKVYFAKKKTWTLDVKLKLVTFFKLLNIILKMKKREQKDCQNSDCTFNFKNRHFSLCTLLLQVANSQCLNFSIVNILVIFVSPLCNMNVWLFWNSLAYTSCWQVHPFHPHVNYVKWALPWNPTANMATTISADIQPWTDW